MSLRIRADGRVLCAAMHSPEPGDTYIDDGLHYILSVERRVLVTEEMDGSGGRGGHRAHGQWWWSGSVPADVIVAPFYSPETSVWLAAQLVVGQVAELAERLSDGPFKDGMAVACEEIMERLRLESLGQPTCLLALPPPSAKEEQT